MKFNALLFALLIASVSVYAQEPKDENEVVGSADKYSSEVFDLISLEKYPQFPGGNKGLAQFLSATLKYPAPCVEERIQGRVLVKFTVFKDGSVGNVEVMEPVHPLLDAEAVRVVSLLPKWTPGIIDGEPVNVWYRLPISFRL